MIKSPLESNILQGYSFNNWELCLRARYCPDAGDSQTQKIKSLSFRSLQQKKWKVKKEIT